MTPISFISIDSVRLDNIADKIEALLAKCDIPGDAQGGTVHRPLIKIKIDWLCDPTQLDKCAQLTHEIRKEFGCNGGVEVDTFEIVLWPDQSIGGGNR